MVKPPSEILPHNGAGLLYVPALKKFAIYDGGGTLHAYRADVDRARELAARLPGHPVEAEPVPEPAPFPRSPGAMPLPPATYLPQGVPLAERIDLPRAWASRPMNAYERSRAMCRRQAAAHDRHRRHRRAGT